MPGDPRTHSKRPTLPSHCSSATQDALPLSERTGLSPATLWVTTARHIVTKHSVDGECMPRLCSSPEPSLLLNGSESPVFYPHPRKTVL